METTDERLEEQVRLTKGEALVITGPEGCGKTTLAKKIASRYGSYVHIAANTLESSFKLGTILENHPATLIIEGCPSFKANHVVKTLIDDEYIVLDLYKGDLSTMPTPYVIFCDDFSSGVPFLGHRLKIVDLGSKQ